MLAKFGLQFLQPAHLFASEKRYRRKLLTYQFEVERSLYLSLIDILRKVGFQIEWHQEKSLIRKTVTGSPSLTFSHNIAFLDACCNQTFHSGITSFEGGSLCNFIARRQWMIVQIL